MGGAPHLVGRRGLSPLAVVSRLRETAVREGGFYRPSVAIVGVLRRMPERVGGGNSPTSRVVAGRGSFLKRVRHAHLPSGCVILVLGGLSRGVHARRHLSQVVVAAGRFGQQHTVGDVLAVPDAAALRDRQHQVVKTIRFRDAAHAVVDRVRPMHVRLPGHMGIVGV